MKAVAFLTRSILCIFSLLFTGCDGCSPKPQHHRAAAVKATPSASQQEQAGKTPDGRPKTQKGVAKILRGQQGQRYIEIRLVDEATGNLIDARTVLFTVAEQKLIQSILNEGKTPVAEYSYEFDSRTIAVTIIGQ